MAVGGWFRQLVPSGTDSTIAASGREGGSTSGENISGDASVATPPFSQAEALQWTTERDPVPR
eukprot:4964472-Lingulodinium_polyedra.AAC.1